MTSYLSYFKLKFKTGLQYRAAALAGISTQIFFGIVYISVYVAFYNSGSGSLPMPIDELVSYLWLNQAFFALVYRQRGYRVDRRYVKRVSPRPSVPFQGYLSAHRSGRKERHVVCRSIPRHGNRQRCFTGIQERKFPLPHRRFHSARS